MTAVTKFETWAVAQGVSIKGVGILEYPGRGFGLTSTRDLQPDDTILVVPASALHNISTVPRAITSAIDATKLPISINGILAYSLMQSTPKTPWDAMLPSRDSLMPSIPFTWHATLQSLLPPGANILLQKQQNKIAQDWRAISSAFPDTNYDDYVYHWFLVSTRTFYWTAPKSKTVKKNGRPKKRDKKLDHDDCITLAPFADLFNHTSHGTVSVSFSPRGYALVATAPVKKGEELSISYGNHSNDFLLAEYGFIISEGVDGGNSWDEVRLDELLEGLFNAQQQETLKERGYWGKWVLDREGICYRTKVAIGLLKMGMGKWERMVDSGVEVKQKDVEDVLGKIFETYLGTVEQKVKELSGLEACQEGQKKMLIERWTQIGQLVEKYLDRVDANRK